MTEELKKYVQAYIDGEDVEYKGTQWNKVTGLRYFIDEDGHEEPADLFRIKPKAEDKALELQEERDSLVIEVNELTSTNKELWATIKSLPTIAEDALIRKLKENEDD